MSPQWLTTKDARLNVRLPADELELWHRRAAADGLTLSDWVYRLATAALLSKQSPEAPPDVLAIPHAMAGAIAIASRRAGVAPAEWAMQALDGALATALKPESERWTSTSPDQGPFVTTAPKAQKAR